MKVMEALAHDLCLQPTEDITVNRPSILNRHLLFVNKNHDHTKRNLFVDEFNDLVNCNKIDFNYEARNIQFHPNNKKGLLNLTMDAGSGCNGSQIELIDVKPVWMTNHYSYFKIGTQGGLDMRAKHVPVSYRAVFPIPLNNERTGVNIGDKSRCDLVSTSLTFSVHDLQSKNHSSLTWLCHAYTVKEDLSVVDCNGRYADENYTFLILEAMNLKNRRTVKFDNGCNEILENLNDKSIEHKWMIKFAELYTHLYKAYTGDQINPCVLLGEKGICSSEGNCFEYRHLTNNVKREMPMVSVLNMVSNLYGNEYYPSAQSCN